MKSARKESQGHWLVKQEPEDYSWDDLERDGSTQWSGVRNFQARNNLRQMKLGDEVFFYHSGKEKRVVGIASVSKAAYPDPTAKEEGWIAVDIKPLKKLPNPVSLTDIKANAKLSDLLLVRQSRLSVMPVGEAEFEEIVRMGK
ncbi:MAG TPA: EVE domain-containing protein [Pyrinomonadaceae bacterium]|nr:EVE domain-containing protein [Pyrinomonadaceae bacterium]